MADTAFPLGIVRASNPNRYAADLSVIYSADSSPGHDYDGELHLTVGPAGLTDMSETRRVCLTRSNQVELLNALDDHTKGIDKGLNGNPLGFPYYGDPSNGSAFIGGYGLTPNGNTYLRFGKKIKNGEGWEQCDYVVLDPTERYRLRNVISASVAAW